MNSNDNREEMTSLTFTCPADCPEHVIDMIEVDEFGPQCCSCGVIVDANRQIRRECHTDRFLKKYDETPEDQRCDHYVYDIEDL
jgi:hypothetical protein